MRFAIVATMIALVNANAPAADWPQFRGPKGASAASEKIAIDWSGPDAIAWKSALPGKGPSSPIVVGNRVFVTASTGINQDRMHVLCFDAGSGKQLWERQFWATGRTLSHPDSGNAAPTPASDGKRVFAFYSSNDLVALDLDGNLLWYRGLAFEHPKAANDVGMSSSPVVAGDVVVVQIENQGDSFAAGIDRATGETKWQVAREAAPAWCSPIVIPGKTPAEDIVLLQSMDRLTAHNPNTGKELWMHKSGCDSISTTAVGDGVVYVPGQGITALDTTSNSKTPSIVWQVSSLNAGAASPVLSGDRLYIINRAGVLNCADSRSGKVLWKLRLEGSFWSTPTLVGDQLICCADSGLIQIVDLPQDGSTGSVASKVDLKEKIQGSPAAANGAVYIRSLNHLIKFK
jgi:outer membrane protein assembly factor BamB